jgi:hypothetical protein
MLDGFVLLTPLLVLLIAVYFVFVGCTNDWDDFGSNNPTPAILTLEYEPGFDTDVKSIFFWFDCKEVGQVEVHTGAVTYKDIDATGGKVGQVSSIFLGSEAEVTCHCWVMTSPSPDDDTVPQIVHKLEPVTQHKASGEDVLPFQLSRQGDEFLLWSY